MKRNIIIAVLILCVASVGSLFAQTEYVDANRASLSSFTLSNGIKVFVKTNDANRVLNISLVLRGGSLVADPAEAGWENLAFKTMARASTEYSYAELTDLLDETSSSIGSNVAFDYSTYSLNVLDKYFDRLLPAWASTLTSPAFAADDFEQVASDAELTLQSREQDPWARTGEVVNKVFFAGHPYEITPEGTIDTIGAASPEALKQWYAEHFSADRIFVVAVGNFDAASLKEKLEKTIGTIPNLHLGIPPAAPEFILSGEGSLTKEAFEQSKGVAYLRGDFAAPGRAQSQFMAGNLAMELFSDILFSVVREKYGAVYSPASYIRSFGANYGSIVMYKASDPDKIKSYIDEAAKILASGRCVSVDPTRPGDEAAYMKIQDALPAYKAKYQNEYFDKARTNAAAAGLMIASYVAMGDPLYWLLDSARIDAVSAGQIQDAFRKYITNNSIRWVALGPQDMLDKYNESDYKYLGK